MKLSAVDDQSGRPRERKVLVRGLREAIGIALDLQAQRMFYTSLGGEVGRARLDGSGARLILEGQGPLTGIVIAP